MSLYCEYSSLKTESDVEQKFIYQLLTGKHPMGFGFNSSDIHTKNILRQHLIGKSKQKYYFPDYLIAMRGIPLLVVEAKAPNEDLDNAFSEARLYAGEVNALFPHNLNVCNKIVVCNGNETWCGYSDQAEPTLKLSFEDFCLENKKYVELLEFCSKEVLSLAANKPYIEVRGKAKFNTPVSNLGGKRVQDEELEENTYGRTLVFENRNIFDPQTEKDRTEIVKNAYIVSSKREQHIEPMYREIKKINLPSEINSTLVSTDNPKEIIDKLGNSINSKENNFSLMLVIGSVGSGKTTFIRYFKEVVLNRDCKDLNNKCEWIFINMNSAPVDMKEIYNWVKTIIISQIKESHIEVDFTNIQTIKKIFRNEIKEFQNGIGNLINQDEKMYNYELYRILSENTNDNEKTLKAYLRYIKEDFHRIPIIVLDNCDKRNKDEQLMMFEVAQWIRENYKCLVILPMRDSTYDIYKNEPPLDTVVKDLVFRIDPPDLLKVLQQRLEYIFRLKEDNEQSYALQNGINVKVKNSDQIEYFKCILMSIRKDSWAMSIFYNLSNRNIRDGIQLFEDFCKSGHIQPEDIFMIRTSTEEYQLPSYKMINPLLRKNRRYFSEEKSNFSNLFYSSYDDDFPDPFVRVDILLWLKKYFREEGPNHVLGYHKVENVINDLQIIGHSEELVFREIKRLIRRGLIYSENQTIDIEYCDLIKISPSGSLHLSLLTNLSYLAACAEDVIYKNPDVMIKISKRISTKRYLDKIPLIATAKDLLEYLQKYREEFLSRPEAYIKDGKYLTLYDLSNSIEVINNLIRSDSGATTIFNNIKKYIKNLQIECTIVRKKGYSILCVLEDGTRGFLATTEEKFKLPTEVYLLLNEGDKLYCKVIEYSLDYNSIQLEFIGKGDDLLQG